MNRKPILIAQIVVLALMGTALTASAQSAKPTNSSKLHNSVALASSSNSASRLNSSQQLVLVGHVTWQGRPAQPDSLQQLPVQLQLKLGDGDVVNREASTADDGSFTVDVSDLPTGDYSYRIKGPTFLANGGKLQLAGEATTSVEMGLMLAGDANGDDVVNIQDFGILKAAFGSASGDPQYDDRADLTGDGVVGITDFSWLKRNFGQDGAPSLAP